MKYLLFLFVSSVASAQTWGSLQADVIVPMNTSNPGTTFTAAIGNAGTVSYSGFTVGGADLGWGNVSANFIVAGNVGAGSNLGPVVMNGTGGPTYPAQSLNYNAIGHDNFVSGPGQNSTLFLPQSVRSTNLSWNYTFTYGATNPYLFGLWDFSVLYTAGGMLMVTQAIESCNGTGNYGFEIEGTWDPVNKTRTTHHSPCIFVPRLQSYRIAANWNLVTGMQYMDIYTIDGTHIGHTETLDVNVADLNTYLGGSAWFGSITFGNNERSYDMTSHNYNVFSDIMVNWTQHPNPYFWPQLDNWTGVVAPSRAVDWTQAGAQPDIPVYANNCTVTGGGTIEPANVTTATLNADIASCGTQVVTNGWPGGNIILPALNNVDLRPVINVSHVVLQGQGGDHTKLRPAGSGGGHGLPHVAMIGSGDGNQNTSPTNGPVVVTFPSGAATAPKGTNTIILASVPNLKVGNPIILDKADNSTENGGVLVTQSTAATGSNGITVVSPGVNGPYNANGTNDTRCPNVNAPTTCFSQQQIVLVTSCNGVSTVGTVCSGTNVTVGISPGLHMPNWSTAQSMSAWWATSVVTGSGIRDLSIDTTNAPSTTPLEIWNCVGCFEVGVASLGLGTPTGADIGTAHVFIEYSKNTTIRSNYYFLTQYLGTTNKISYGVVDMASSDTLIENNIFHGVQTPMPTNGPSSGQVTAYNYCIGSPWQSAGYSIPAINDHAAGVDSRLAEGNVCNGFTLDEIHGTSNLFSAVRNRFTGANPVCWQSGTTWAAMTWGACTTNYSPVIPQGFHRFPNLIGNVLGSLGLNTTYNAGGGGTATNVLQIGLVNTVINANVPSNLDPNMLSMVWGTADSATDNGHTVWTARFNSAEVPNGFSSYALSQWALSNPVPANNTIPASFYRASAPSWFGSTTWPPIGPDVTGGDIVRCSGGTYDRALMPSGYAALCTGGTTSQDASGHAYAIPAMKAYYAMGGNPYGTGSQLSFNANTLYSLSPTVTAPTLGPWTNTQVIGTQTLAANNFSSTVTWSCLNGCSGATAPPSGLGGTCITGTTGVNCTLAGTLNAPGTFNFTIRATDGVSIVDSPFSVIVNAVPSISTVSMSSGAVNTPYSFTLQSSGGTGSITFALTSGSLPTGLSLNTATGMISGTPTAANNFPFSVTPTDSVGVTGAAQNLSITINGNCAITPTSLSFTARQTVNTQFVATGCNTSTFTIIAGSLAGSGLSLSPNGLLSGTAVAGTYNFTPAYDIGTDPITFIVGRSTVPGTAVNLNTVIQGRGTVH